MEGQCPFTESVRERPFLSVPTGRGAGRNTQGSSCAKALRSDRAIVAGGGQEVPMCLDERAGLW